MLYVSLSMQGIKQRTPKLFYQFALSDLVSADHPYRRIEQHLNLSFLYKKTRHLYGTEGQQSIDPVVFVKMCLLGYFNNITSDRGLCRYCTDSISARWFLGYDIDEALPVHSTLSRTRNLFGGELFEEVFCLVLGLCVDAGLVEGKRQAFDSGLVKANASIDSMQRIVIMNDASEYCRQVEQENAEPDSLPDRSKDSDPDGDAPADSLHSVDCMTEGPVKRKRSNKTHVSASDLDARMARKTGKPTDMYYHGQISVDSQHGVIVGAMADYADLEDHKSLPGLLERVQSNLSGHGLAIEEILADSKYNTITTIEACQQKGITAFMQNPSGYKREREGFTFDEAANAYRCPQGAVLTYKGQQPCRDYFNNVYRSSSVDCANCPIRSQCITGKSKVKRITHSSGKAMYDLMDGRLQSDYGRRMLAKRKGIVEPVIGNLMHHNGMKKVYGRGLAAAEKHVLMSSISFNLKKWLRYGAPKPLRKASSAALDRGRAVIDDLSGNLFRKPFGSDYFLRQTLNYS
jgi:transposase